jgi:acyl-CoA synthetase (AMP-forming)/AMP-acid ligase II
VDLNVLLDMVVSGYGDRPAITGGGVTITYRDLGSAAAAGAIELAERHSEGLLYLGPNHPAYAVALFSAAAAAVPLIALNYRLGHDQLRPQLGAHPSAFVVSDTPIDGHENATRDEYVRSLLSGCGPLPPSGAGPDDLAVRLYTSGTTGTPKAALLRHRHLMSYLFGTVEFGSAADDEAALVTVPPYHVAGLANLLSNLYAGRRVVYLESFDPESWLDTVRAERVSQAMVVPTMLARLVRHLGGDRAEVPTLRTLSYGGSRTPLPVIEAALRAFPDTGFVNAYGLTETSSTIALLGPDDHRAAFESDELSGRARLSSVGRVVPGIELEIRDDGDRPLNVGETGRINLRGEQVSGEYDGLQLLDADGWFATGDRGHVDEDGYLFIEGRSDDMIIRGGENISPAEIEDVLIDHPAVIDVAVVGVPDEEWGQRIAAVVTVDAKAGADEIELKEWVRKQLRSSKTPDVVVFRADLPRTPTGKLLRRQLIDELLAARDKQPEG